jgi:cyclic di-GMP phosphodiesterase
VDDGQLEKYARDVKKIVLREQEQARQLEQLMSQVQVYATELRTSRERECQRHLEVDHVYEEALTRLAQAIALRHHEKGSLGRLSQYCGTLCRSLSLSEEETHQIAFGAQLHDIGEIGISDEILFKPGPLTEDETATMHWHCWMGANLLRGSRSPLFDTAHQIALTHHERWNGMGYPHALSGTEIPLCGRIVMLADVYDALRGTKPAKAALSHTMAKKVILEGNERLSPDYFDPDLLAAFERTEREFDEIFQRPYPR